MIGFGIVGGIGFFNCQIAGFRMVIRIIDGRCAGFHLISGSWSQVDNRRRRICCRCATGSTSSRPARRAASRSTASRSSRCASAGRIGGRIIGYIYFCALGLIGFNLNAQRLHCLVQLTAVDGVGGFGRNQAGRYVLDAAGDDLSLNGTAADAYYAISPITACKIISSVIDYHAVVGSITGRSSACSVIIGLYIRRMTAQKDGVAFYLRNVVAQSKYIRFSSSDFIIVTNRIAVIAINH